MTTEIKENTSALEALDFAITCAVNYYIGNPNSGYINYRTCGKTAKFIATIHDFNNCNINEKPICFDCIQNGHWDKGCDCCDIDNTLIDLKPL